MLSLLAESAALGPDSTLTIGLAIVGGTGLLALGSWSAILRHTQDNHGAKIEKLEGRLIPLEADKTKREAIADYKLNRHRPSRDAPRPRPDESSA